MARAAAAAAKAAKKKEEKKRAEAEATAKTAAAAAKAAEEAEGEEAAKGRDGEGDGDALAVGDIIVSNDASVIKKHTYGVITSLEAGGEYGHVQWEILNAGKPPGTRVQPERVCFEGALLRCCLPTCCLLLASLGLLAAAAVSLEASRTVSVLGPRAKLARLAVPTRLPLSFSACGCLSLSRCALAAAILSNPLEGGSVRQ